MSPDTLKRNIVIPNEEFFDNIVDELCNAGMVKLIVRGGSMFPFFRDSKDVVVLRALTDDEQLRRGGVYLFKYNGRYILHRLVRISRRGRQSVTRNNVPHALRSEKTQASPDEVARNTTKEQVANYVYLFRGDGNPKGVERTSRDMIYAAAEKRIAPSGEEWSCNSMSWKVLSALWPKDYLFRRLLVGVLRRLSRCRWWRS